MKIWERVVKIRLRREVTISGQLYGFIERESATDVMFALSADLELQRREQMYEGRCFQTTLSSVARAGTGGREVDVCSEKKRI